MVSFKRKKAVLSRKTEWVDLKIDQPLSVKLRRCDIAIKKRRAKYFAFERKIFFMNTQRCAVAANIHITCTN
jgi:hypothetical protein